MASSTRYSLRFDGIYMKVDMWLNGVHIGNHPYGYTTFEYDVTPHLKASGPNVLAVRVNNMGANSRWYRASEHVCLFTQAKHRDLGCALHPSTYVPGGGCQTRLESINASRIHKRVSNP